MTGDPIAAILLCLLLSFFLLAANALLSSRPSSRW